MILRIVHSRLPNDEKKACGALSADERKEFVRRNLPLSELPLYLRGDAGFDVPIYAVWGNHEDLEVVRKFRSGEYRIGNLNLLHEGVSVHLNGLHLFGLGGNFLVGAKLFQQPIAGGGGKIWSVLEQYTRLLDTVRQNAEPKEKRLLVSHVSPGKEPFMTLVGAWAGCDWIVSGHMDPPFALAWNEFAVRTVEEAERRLQGRISEIEEVFASLGEDSRERNLASMGRWSSLPQMKITIGRGEQVPIWYAKMWNVNLPDAETGYAVLDIDGESGGVMTGHRMRS